MKQANGKNKDLTTNSEQGEISFAVTACDMAQELYNKVPAETTSCESHYETKMYTCVLLAGLCIAFPPLAFVAWYMYCSAKKELGCSIPKFEKERNEKKNSYESTTYA